MRTPGRVLPLVALATLLLGPSMVRAACCYFAAKGQDVSQPAQKAFLTWDPDEKVETFAVQPKFEGNARDFGMVVPTPAKPQIERLPREFFKELDVFTVLEPRDAVKPNQFGGVGLTGGFGTNGGLGTLGGLGQPGGLNQFGGLGQPGAPAVFGMFGGIGGLGGLTNVKPERVTVVDAGLVGSLTYKTIQAQRADDLYAWLKDNHYNYSGAEAALDLYVKQKWFFTVMKIDPRQLVKRSDGSYEGEVTPTRFQFASDKPIYPLKIAQPSVKDKIEVLLYIQAPYKVDLPGELSYEYTWTPLWCTAAARAVPEKLTKPERDWLKHARPQAEKYALTLAELANKGHEPATLEWAKKITDKDLAVLAGKEKYNRVASNEDVAKLKLLKGHLSKDQFVTRLRKVFAKDELDRDLEFVRARVDGKDDEIEYFSLLPGTSP